jgi:hypothetical protein
VDAAEWPPLQPVHIWCTVVAKLCRGYILYTYIYIYIDVFAAVAEHIVTVQNNCVQQIQLM